MWFYGAFWHAITTWYELYNTSELLRTRPETTWNFEKMIKDVISKIISVATWSVLTRNNYLV